MAFLIPYSLITQGLYTGIATTISAMTVGSYKVIKSIYNHKNEDIHLFIKKLDIERKLSLIESVIKYTKEEEFAQNENTEKIEKTDKYKMPDMLTSGQLKSLHIINTYNKTKHNSNSNADPIHLCLTHLSNTITEIHLNLKIIDQKVTDHDRKWLRNYRRFNIQKELDQLEINVKILNDRYEDLLKISILMKS